MVVHSILLRCLAQDEKVLAVHSFHLLLICRIVVTTGISIIIPPKHTSNHTSESYLPCKHAWLTPEFSEIASFCLVVVQCDVTGLHDTKSSMHLRTNLV